MFEKLKKNSEAGDHARDNRRSRSVLVAVLLILVVLLSAGSGLYAGASFFAQQAPNVTITTTIFTTTTSWTTSTIWSTLTQTVQGVLTTIEYTTSTSTATVTAGSTVNFGKTGIGSRSDTFAGYLVAYKFSLSAPMTVTSITSYWEYVSGNDFANVAIYRSDGTNPTSLVVAPSAQAVTSTGWMTFTVTPTYLAPGTYFLAQTASGPGFKRHYDISSTGDYKWRMVAWQAFPDPFGTPSGTGAVQASIYASGYQA